MPNFMNFFSSIYPKVAENTPVLLYFGILSNIKFKASRKFSSINRSASSRTRISQFLTETVIFDVLCKSSFNLPGVPTRIFPPFLLKYLISILRFLPPINCATLICDNAPVSNFYVMRNIYYANSRVGDIIIALTSWISLT